MYVGKEKKLEYYVDVRKAKKLTMEKTTGWLNAAGEIHAVIIILTRCVVSVRYMRLYRFP